MPVAVTYPGVYVQEEPSGVRTIAGVSTSVTMFIGRAAQGPLNEPTQLFSFTDFERTFADDTSVGDMSRYAKLFFTNGGSECYVMRVAENATQATMQMVAEDSTAVLELTAKHAGAIGNTLRAQVVYPAGNPEGEFNIQLWRVETSSSGAATQADLEEFKNLTMDPNSAKFAPDILTQRSKLVNATSLVDTAGNGGFSQAARPIPYIHGTASDIRDKLEDIFNNHGDLRVSVGGNLVDVDLQSVNTPQVSASGGSDAVLNEFATRITGVIDTALPAGVTVDVSFESGPTPAAVDVGCDRSCFLRITASNDDHSVIVRAAPSGSDLAVPLLMGVDQGGYEVSAYAYRRPAPNGITINLRTSANYLALASARQDSITAVHLPELQGDGTYAQQEIAIDDLVASNAAHPLYREDVTAYPDEGADGVRVALNVIADAINEYQEAHPLTFFWTADVWGARLAVLPRGLSQDLFTGAMTSNDAGGAGSGTDLGDWASENVKNYMVGPGGTLGFQNAGTSGDDGTPPTSSEYEDAFTVIDREVDIFNLMVLPPTDDPGLDLTEVYRSASVFCQQRRAFLLMDAPIDWTSAQEAGTGVAALRSGLVKDHSAIFFPQLQITENGRRQYVGSSGAMAGLMARIDSSRGVWKAPAGTEADIRGVSGVEYRLSDPENGVTNQRAVNTIRHFPTGVVAWGARTMDGDNDAGSEWKYIPIRRLALYMEESLYRGLKWVVFEPNDEPLWGQIRMNVGAFMHGLFRQGAFQGKTKSEAYFVKCDTETTTQTDRNLGIVNIWVGFAPLKPAEFVVLHLQQIAGQIET